MIPVPAMFRVLPVKITYLFNYRHYFSFLRFKLLKKRHRN